MPRSYRTHFESKAGYHGSMLDTVSRVLANITANQTTRQIIGAPTHPAFIDDDGVRIFVQTLPADADGTILATLRKYDASADAYVSLSAQFSLEAGGTLVAMESVKIPLLTTLTDDQVFFNLGDTLVLEVVNNSAAIDTQAVDLGVSATFLIKE